MLTSDAPLPVWLALWSDAPLPAIRAYKRELLKAWKGLRLHEFHSTPLNVRSLQVQHESWADIQPKEWL